MSPVLLHCEYTYAFLKPWMVLSLIGGIYSSVLANFGVKLRIIRIMSLPPQFLFSKPIGCFDFQGAFLWSLLAGIWQVGFRCLLSLSKPMIQWHLGKYQTDTRCTHTTLWHHWCAHDHPVILWNLQYNGLASVPGICSFVDFYNALFTCKLGAAKYGERVSPTNQLQWASILDSKDLRPFYTSENCFSPSFEV